MTDSCGYYSGSVGLYCVPLQREGSLSRGARGGGGERERELEAILTELQKNHKRDMESKKEEEVVEREQEEEEEEEEGEEEGEEEEEGRVVPRKALELKENDSPVQKEVEQEVKEEGERDVVREEEERRYPIGRRGREENRVLELGAREREAAKGDQNQRRLFSQRPGHLLDQDRRRVRRTPLSDEEGLTHFPVDLGDFDPEAYLGGQLLAEGENEMRKFQFNQRRSQETPYDRQLKDVRIPR